jgi:drug/metabolite transporter (DMT)-like permease
MTVAVRLGFSREADAAVATAATVIVALTVAVLAALVAGPHDVADAWPYALAGLLAPGSSQLLFTFAIRSVGASRTSVVVGAAPLVAVAIAFGVLGEPVTAPLVAGALAIVAGGVALVAERRPEHLRASGLFLAALCTLFFAARDNLVRHLSGTNSVPPTVAAATTLLIGALVAVAYARKVPSATAPARLHAGRCLLRAVLRLPVRGVLPWSRVRRVPDGRHRGALGCRPLRPAVAAQRARRAPSRRRRCVDGRWRHVDRDLPLR